MTSHERALELIRLALRDEKAAHVLQADSTIDKTLKAEQIEPFSGRQILHARKLQPV
jgi:uncharacterized protein YabN with tetrapyrrole methylase and pyrophosphatase domain